MSKPKFDGVDIKLGETTYVVPPLVLRDLKRLRAEFTTIHGMAEGAVSVTDEQVDAVIKVIHAAVARNYDTVTVEMIEEVLDLGNMPKILAAIMAQSNMEKTTGTGQGN